MNTLKTKTNILLHFIYIYMCVCVCVCVCACVCACVCVTLGDTRWGSWLRHFATRSSRFPFPMVSVEFLIDNMTLGLT